ncbi:hypothetical protein MN608_11635 [Microdochium nivale]|nr:hypothetical protein MN608_11635 [Microdochium nivale]
MLVVYFAISSVQLSVNISHSYSRPGTKIDPVNAYTVGFGGLIVGAFIIVAAVWSKTSFALTLVRIAGPKLKIVLWAIIVLMNTFQFAAIIIQWTQCSPIEKIWNRRLTGGTCWPVPISVGGFHVRRSVFGIRGGELTIWASAEIATAIMAASIPVLRTLIRDVKSSAAGSWPRASAYLCSSSHPEERTPKPVYEIYGGAPGNENNTNNIVSVSAANQVSSGKSRSHDPYFL